MFANAIRAQARAAFTSSARTRFAAASRLVSQLSALRISEPSSRTFSSFPALRQDGFRGGFEERGFRKPPPPSNTIFVGNIPFSADEIDLQELFQEFATPKEVRVARSTDGQMRGFAHVEFASVDDASRVVDAHKEAIFTLQNRDLRVDFAPVKTDVVKEPNHKLYFNDFNYDEDTLRQAFKQHAQNIVDIHIMHNPQTNQSLRAGFIEFSNIDESTEALNEINGTTLESGERLNLSYARPRKPRTDSRSGGGRSPEYSGHNRSRGYGGDWNGGRKSEGYGRQGRQGGGGGGRY